MAMQKGDMKSVDVLMTTTGAVFGVKVEPGFERHVYGIDLTPVTNGIATVSQRVSAATPVDTVKVCTGGNRFIPAGGFGEKPLFSLKENSYFLGMATAANVQATVFYADERA